MLKAQSPKPPPGQLILRVKRARRLPAMDYNGLVDAFVEVKHEGEIELSSSSCVPNQTVFVRTPVAYQTMAPSWDFQHVFQLREGEMKGELEIHVYIEGRGLVKDDYVGGATIKWRCNKEWGEEVIADKWYDVGEGDRSRRHKGGMVNKLWRRNTGESLLTSCENLGQVQCQAFIVFLSHLDTAAPLNSHKRESIVHAIGVRDELRLCQIRGVKLLLAITRWESRELYTRKRRALKAWSEIQDTRTRAVLTPLPTLSLIQKQAESDTEHTSSSQSSNSSAPWTSISTDHDDLQSMNSRAEIPEVDGDLENNDSLNSCQATQMRILELVRMPSSRAACGAALEGGNAVAEDDLTVSNIGQHTDESSSIFVAVRIRPGVKIRHNQKWKTVTAQPGGKQLLTRRNGSEAPRVFAYDLCFDEESTQQDIFDGLGVSILQNSIKGFNTSLFAYGPTSCGKSYTMLGPSGADMGLIPRIAHHLFFLAKKLEYNCSVEVSCLEIYNERVRDLINRTEQTSNSSGGLRVRESPSGVFVEGLTRSLVKDMTDMESMITAAVEARASSQNVRSRMVEGCKINQSLTALGRVITALGKGKGQNREHIPYRDSTLTMILKESLGGNSKTAMLACISPESRDIEETLSTLRYANSAKRIKTRAVVNKDPTASMISRLQAEVERLRSLLTCTESEAQQTSGGSFGVMRKESDGQIAAIEGKIREQQISLARRDNIDMPAEVQSNRRCSLNSTITLKSYDGGPYLLLMHPDPTLEGRLRYAIREGRTRLGRLAAASRSSSLYHEVLSSICDSSAKDKELESTMSRCELEFPGGIGLRPNHCVFFRDSTIITVAPLQSNARVFVDGKAIYNTTSLHHGTRVVLGCCTLVFNVIWPEDKNPSQIRGDTVHQGYALMSHSQILKEVGFGGAEEEDSASPHHQSTLPDLKEMFISKHLRGLEDDCLHARLMALEANTVTQDLEQDVTFTVEIRIPVNAKAGSCTLQHLVEAGDISIMVVATRDEATLIHNGDINVSPFLNKYQNIVARWPASQFAFIQESLMDVYVSLSELIREKEERGQGTLLVDIFESVIARGRLSLLGNNGNLNPAIAQSGIGLQQLAEMFGKCGMPCKPDNVKSILSEYDKDSNGVLEVDEFKALMRNVMNSCFNECLKHENASLDFTKPVESHGIENKMQCGENPLALPRRNRPSYRGTAIIGMAWASRERQKNLYSSSQLPGKELWQCG